MLGSLVEKGLTTPQQYPLTINALLAACNQTSNREPVVSYDEATVQSALDELRERRLIRLVLPSHGRSVVRYRHVLDEASGLDDRQCAILAVLLLRGPQTVGELRTRTERMAHFDGLAEVQHELDLLHGRDEPLAGTSGAGRVRRRSGGRARWSTPTIAHRSLVRTPAPRRARPRTARASCHPWRRMTRRATCARSWPPSGPRSPSSGARWRSCAPASAADRSERRGAHAVRLDLVDGRARW